LFPLDRGRYSECLRWPEVRWPEVRDARPNQWLVVEILDARAGADHRLVDRVAVIEIGADGRATMKRSGELNRQHPNREFCFAHTSMPELKIEERFWMGFRGLRAADLSP
jgi:hypothetical protein